MDVIFNAEVRREIGLDGEGDDEVLSPEILGRLVYEVGLPKRESAKISGSNEASDDLEPRYRNELSVQSTNGSKDVTKKRTRSRRGQQESIRIAQPQRRLVGKVAIVTAADDGDMGGFIALRLAAEGAAVALISPRVPTRLMQKLNRFRQGATHTIGDATRSLDVGRLIDDCMAEFGQIDILVNNSGITQTTPFAEMSNENLDEAIALNLTVAMKMARACIPHLRSPGAVIINIPAMLSHDRLPGFAVTTAGRAGLIGFTHSLAAELGPQGIRVVGVALETVMQATNQSNDRQPDSELTLQGETFDRVATAASGSVADAVAFLASDDARVINGVTIPVD